MGESYTFAVDVIRTVCDRLAARAGDLRLLIEAGSPFEPRVVWEVFLACKHRQAGYPFCEVASKPTYDSEGVSDNGGHPDRSLGGLRVGGPDGGGAGCGGP